MMPGQKQCVDGNKEVVQLFEHWLEKAKQGDIDFAAVLACRGPCDVDRGYGGVQGREAIACFSLDYLKLQLMGDFNNRMNPPSNADATADKWAYNIGRSPVSYDFIAWLVNAEMTRVREGAPFPLKVSFYVGKDGDMRNALASDWRVQAFLNIIKPALAFVGAIESNEAQNGRLQECFSFIPAVEGARHGEKVPVFKSPKVWHWPRTPVTITLRESDRQLHRNSNLEEWLKFAEYLARQGERVVIVRDTDKADEPFHGCETCPEASKDIQARLSLYEQAKCNLFVSNGPATLAFFTERPWLMFAAPNPKDSYFPNTPDGWRTFAGIGPGEQFPWSRPDQRIIWQADTFEVMRDAWEGLESLQVAA
jgi:hypothetical protein